MNHRGKPPERHLVDGREMTAVEIAEMLGITLAALRIRRSRLGGISYQLIVDMFRSNQLGRDGCYRYLVEGEWRTIRQIAESLGVKPHSIVGWRSQHKGASMEDAIEHFRRFNQNGRRHNANGGGGRPPIRHQVGNREYTAQQVADRYGVTRQSVAAYLQAHSMAEALKHYRERERRKRKKAEAKIMRILGF